MARPEAAETVADRLLGHHKVGLAGSTSRGSASFLWCSTPCRGPPTTEKCRNDRESLCGRVQPCKSTGVWCHVDGGVWRRGDLGCLVGDLAGARLVVDLVPGHVGLGPADRDAVGARSQTHAWAAEADLQSAPGSEYWIGNRRLHPSRGP